METIQGKYKDALCVLQCVWFSQNASLYLPCIVSIFMKQNDRITDGQMNDCVAFFGTLEYLYLRIPLETKSTFQANIPYQK